VPSPADPLLSLDDAADALGTGPDFITHLVTTGQLDHTGPADELRIPESALIAYAITTGDSSTDAESPASPEFSATAQTHDSNGCDGQEVAA
jgi:hypothetical protein